MLESVQCPPPHAQDTVPQHRPSGPQMNSIAQQVLITHALSPSQRTLDPLHPLKASRWHSSPSSSTHDRSSIHTAPSIQKSSGLLQEPSCA